ncbi:hypothetical protein ROT00_03365 [Agromyces mediolanus]|uniref:hypothetical protein n=1 Tax=Agromyces mediolanus TaxID=41986 RepID=UPI003836F618
MTVPAGPVRFVAQPDRAKAASVPRWNRGFITTGAVLLGVAAAGVVALLATGFGSWFTIGLVVVFGLAAGGLLLTSVLRGRMLRLLLAPGAPVLVVTGTGISTGGLPEIPWSELAFIGVLNDRPRTARLRSVPIFGQAGGLALRAGNGTVLCELGVRDGEALRARTPDRGAASRIGLYGRWPDGARRGLVPLLMDAVLADDVAATAVQLLLAEASARGIPHALFEQALPFTAWKGPLLDPAWPGAEQG